MHYASANVIDTLNSQFWFSTNLRGVDPYADPASFGRSLRLNPNAKLNWVAKVTGFITTPLFKKKNISGWLHCPEEKENLGLEKPCTRLPSLVCATGEVFRSPAVSNDGLATIDLQIEALEFCSDSAPCSSPANLINERDPERRRYLRVEYRHRNNPLPRERDRVRICGELRWDTDREGWWEIHPRTATDVRFVLEPTVRRP
jgi:hypothetical protein